MKRLIILFIVLTLFINFSLISAIPFVQLNKTINYTITSEYPIIKLWTNISMQNVNSSDYWDNLDSPDDIEYSEVGGDAFWDAEVDIGGYDFTSDLTGKFGDVEVIDKYGGSGKITFNTGDYIDYDATANDFRFWIGSTEEYSFSASQLNLKGNDLNTSGTGIFKTIMLTDLGSDNFLRFDVMRNSLTAERDLTFNVSDVDRTINLIGDTTLGDWFSQPVKNTSSPVFADIITPRINSNTSQDLILFDILSIDDALDGEALVVFRNAPEGTDYLKFYIANSRHAVINAGNYPILNLQVVGTQQLVISSTTTWSYNNLNMVDNSLLNVDDIGIGTLTPSYPLEVNEFVGASNISIYALGNISATGYITRTSVFDKSKNVWDYIKDADYYLDEGKIIHERFYGYAGESEITDYSRPEIEKYIDEECDEIISEHIVEKCDIVEDKIVCEDVIESVSKYVNCRKVIKEREIYPYIKTEKGISLGGEIDALRQAIFELKEKLCKYHPEDKICLELPKL